MGIVNVTPDSFSDGGRYRAGRRRARALRPAGGAGRRHPRHRRRVHPPRRAPARHRRATRARAAGAAPRGHAGRAGVGRHGRPGGDGRGAGARRRHPQRRARAAGARRAGRRGRAPVGRRLPDAHAGRARLDAGRAALRRRRRRRRGRAPSWPQRRDAALAAGIARERIALDPGIGFGKTPAHNLALAVGSSGGCWRSAVRCCSAGRASPRWASSPAGRWASASPPAWRRRWPRCSRAPPSCACTTWPRPSTR